MMTLDWNLGWTNQSEIGGASFYNQSVSQPANVYTPLFNINSGVPAFTSVAQLGDGSIPTGASSPSARPTITVVPADYHNPYTINWNVSIQRAIKKNYMVELSYVGIHNIGFSGNYNWNSRPWGTGIDANGKVIDLSLPENWAYRNTWVNNTSGVNGTQAYKVYPNLGGVNYQCNCVAHDLPFGHHQVGKTLLARLELPHVRHLAEGYPERSGQSLPERQLMRAVTSTDSEISLRQFHDLRTAVRKGQEVDEPRPLAGRAVRRLQLLLELFASGRPHPRASATRAARISTR